MPIPLRHCWQAVLSVLMLAFLVMATPAYAQQASASVNGVVSDESGAAVPGAQVKLTNVDTAVARTTTSNGSGTYVFLNVTPGIYTVDVEAAGFSKISQSQVKLDVDQTATFDFHLKIGQTQETVTVEASNAGIESSSTELGTVIGGKQVSTLALNGRNFTQLLTLTPGAAPVNLDQTGSGGGAFVGNSLGSFSFPAINGARVRSNIFLLDGVNNQNTFLSSNNYTPIPDAIGEFKVQTHNDDTQYGAVVGGIVNVVSKSGTNTYHGTLWNYLRNEAFDANSFANKRTIPITRRNPLRQNQFGAAVGGPVSIPKLYNGKDRTFFFAAYEGYRQHGASQIISTTPSPAQRAGDFGALCTGTFSNGLCSNPSQQLYNIFSSVPDPNNPGSYKRDIFPNNVIPSNLISPTSLAYQNIFPQGTPDPSRPGFYLASSTGGSTTDQDEGQIRVDQTIGSHDQIFGRYSRYYQLVNAASTVVQRRIAPIYGNNWTIHETHTFGANAILDVYMARNYGNNEVNLTVNGGDALLDALKATGVSTTFLTLGDTVTAPGLSIGNYIGISYNQIQNTSLADVWEYGGNFTKILGRHIIKFGGSVETNGFFSPIRGSHESFTANQTGGLGANIGLGGDPYASFLLGVPSNAGNRIVDEKVHGGYSDAFYAHDQWKATKNLTVNVGVRYDLKLWPIYGAGEDLYTGEPNPITGEYILSALPGPCTATKGAPCIPNGIYVNNGGLPTPYDGLPPHVVVTPNKNHNILNNDHTNIALRVGLAYRVSDKLSVRAGYGRFYDTWGAVAQNTQNFNGNWPLTSLELNGLNPLTATDPINDPLHFGSGGGIIYPTPDPYKAGTWSVDPKYKTPYSDQFNIGIQQELPGSILLDMNYVGSISQRLDKTAVQNVATPGPGDPVPRQPFPYLGNAWFQQSIGNSNFNGLEVSLNKRASRNLAFLVSYAWTKSIDDGCSGDIGAGCSIQNVYDRTSDRSVSAFDVPHVFSASFTATSPYGKGHQLGNRLVTTLASDWGLTGIVRVNSGTPYDIGASNAIPNICNCANTERASLRGNPKKSGSKGLNTLWFNTDAIKIPDQFTFGTMGRNSLRNALYKNTDLTVFRQFHIGLGESRVFEFRADAFNLFNESVYATPNTTIGDPNFGRVQGVRNSSRQLQFALKFNF